MKGFISALNFLTIIPIKNTSFQKENIVESMTYFPLAGLVIGLILAGANILYSHFFDSLASSLLTVLTLALITGGLHLDGLADTFDGLGSVRSKEKMLEIMKDSRIGTMGVLSLIFVILLKIIFLSKISMFSKNSILILMPILSRWSMLIPIYFFKYARENNQGLGSSFSNNISKKIFVVATLAAIVLCTCVSGFTGVYAFIAITISTVIISLVVKNKIGGFTGDTLGATNEINEVIVLALWSVVI